MAGHWSSAVAEEVVARTLRDAHCFEFESLEKLANEGEKLIKTGVDLANRYSEVGKL